MKRLFGTDGIRGKAGEFPLDAATVAAIGESVGRRYAERLGRKPRLLTGRDTRESGEMLETAFHAGTRAAGAAVESAGVITTPGVAFATRKFNFDAGIVISASHNPFEDNGLKIFSPTGEKVDEQTERLIEADIAAAARAASGAGDTATVEISRINEFHTGYSSHLAANFPDLDLRGVKIAVDCANGAASAFAPPLFENLGAEVSTINDRPDGRNINLDCGSLYLESVRALTLENSAAVGVAFDGDSDRALFIDEQGNVVDGDAVLWVLGRMFKDQGLLRNDTVVATVMSNIGLQIAFETCGIELVRAAVGDKYVLDELLKTGSDLGGEQSGHIIVPAQSLVGDGIMTALFLLRAMQIGGGKLSHLTAGFVRYPQVLVNVKVKEKRPFDDVDGIASLSRQIERELDGEGRLLLRYSGTENLARVMIEGKDQTAIESQARRLAQAISVSLG